MLLASTTPCPLLKVQYYALHSHRNQALHLAAVEMLGRVDSGMQQLSGQGAIAVALWCIALYSGALCNVPHTSRRTID